MKPRRDSSLIKRGYEEHARRSCDRSKLTVRIRKDAGRDRLCTRRKRSRKRLPVLFVLFVGESSRVKVTMYVWIPARPAGYTEPIPLLAQSRTSSSRTSSSRKVC
ncbi:hypothetical protein F2Q69_00040917 [Brassica cretica]|uniref:Uncharacterized protein n=1 Tax=Brassica cretica TaxID=69181 RepID=A0A8S9NH89_BRACR|nr:hypothetical protein F2Q69_00040917 [Brassica cretica]